ncbi:MAG: glycosyl transferase family 2 [Planctomycetaceae bacterium]|nr:glycosyl transferase family 2 [Planctomycetaceae bacterium]
MPDQPQHDDNSTSQLRYSVVVPVYNEDVNITPFCEAAKSQLNDDFEMLVCYDFDEDKTLPVLASIPASEKPTNIRLIRNDLGQGVRYAIEAGFRAATTPVVICVMCDMSDDFDDIEKMIGLIEDGATVVSASRHMKGGRQVCKPSLKSFLSRCAGRSLYWLAGVPTRDPTNCFKAYRREFLDVTPIADKTEGFNLGLELTVKAHFSGGRIDEIPTVWHDRSAGESRFRLFAWMPQYLRWYFWAIRKRWLG